jgi:hypothetical protein
MKVNNGSAKDAKVYVKVTAVFSEDGRLTPLSLTWEDGREYPIDRVLDVRPSPALKAGGQGDRYTIRTCGRESFLFFERSPRLTDPNLGRWFVERRLQ